MQQITSLCPESFSFHATQFPDYCIDLLFVIVLFLLAQNRRERYSMPKHQEIHNLAGSLIERVTQKYGNLTGLLYFYSIHL